MTDQEYSRVITLPQGQLFFDISNDQYHTTTYSSCLHVIDDISTNRKFNIPYMCDAFDIDAIRIKNTYDIDTILSLEIGFGSSTKLSIPFNLLKNLINIKHDKEYTTLCIPHSMFIVDNLPHGMLSYDFEYHEPYILISSVSSIKYDLVLQCTSYNLSIRRNIAIRPRRKFIVNNYEINNIDNNISIINLPKDGYCIGFFIETKILPECIKIHLDNDIVCGHISKEKYKCVNPNNTSLYWITFYQNITWNNINYVYNGHCNNGFLELICSDALERSSNTVYFLVQKNMITSAGMTGVIST